MSAVKQLVNEPAKPVIRQSLRLKQIRRLSNILVLADRSATGALLIRGARRWSVTRSILQLLLGYKWAFGSLSEASAAAARFIPMSHEHADNAWTHLNLAQQARPSDYPVLFHLTSLIPASPTIFDLGGNVGNLFYCYERYFSFPAGLRWIVFDLPEMESIGQSIASSRDEHRLRFTTAFEEMNHADILLASGSLHYFDLPLADSLAKLTRKPRHVIINRTPLTDGNPVATVQDAGTYLVACKLHNKGELIGQLQGLGYDLVDSWMVPELSVQIPCFPELSVPAYSGCYLRLK